MDRQIRIEGDVAYVPLTKGYEAVIDAADVSLVEGRLWRAMEVRDRLGEIKVVYATAQRSRSEHGPMTIYMHRVIFGASSAPTIDHQDTDGLNNRRYNLREASAAQNARNRKTHRNNSSGAKGVIWNKARGKWQAYIRANGNAKHLGLFDSRDEAAAAYATASANLHGEFGRLA